MNKRFSQALGVGFVLNFFVSCFVFAFNCFAAIAEHTGFGQVLANTFVSALLMQLVFTFALLEFYRFIDERDRIEAEERARREAADRDEQPTDSEPTNANKPEKR